MTTPLPHAPMAPLSYAEIALSPRGACLIGADALAAGRADIAERLVFSLGPALLPDPERNPWEGPAGEFWTRALRLDRPEWLRRSIGALPKESAKACARALLMQSAKSRAFESFEYLLSLGAARRSWKLLEAAYEAGGAGAAQKVKKPTALEAESLLRPHSARGKSLEDLLWCAGFLDPLSRFDSAWIERLAYHAGDDLAEACLRHAPRIPLELSAQTAPHMAARLAAQSSERSALAVCELFPPDPAARLPEASLSLCHGPHTRISLACKDISLMECAVLGQCPALCAELSAAGAPLPSAARLRSLMLENAPHWQREALAAHFLRVNAFRDSQELGAATAPATARPARPRGL